jgi:hypothetical protein
MKKLNLTFLGAIMVALILFTTTGCKKDKDKDDNTTVASKPNDQQGSSEADAAINDVNDFISNKKGGGTSQSKVSAYNLPCGVVEMDSTETSVGSGIYVYKFTYGNASPCGYKKKSGQVSWVLTNGTAFNNSGAVFTITFTNYVVEVIATGNIVTLNGNIVVTNQTGGYIWQPVVGGADVTHKVRGTFTVKYSDGTERARTYAQLRTWSSATDDWAGLTLTIAGDSLVSGVSYYEFGRTYENDYEYKTEMITNYVWSNCGTTWAGPYVLKTGHAKLHVVNPYFTTAYFEVEGGYYYNYNNLSSTPTLVNDCTTNAYKITTVIGTSSTTSYQLY